MPSTLESYRIGLDIQQSDATKRNLEALKSAFSDVNASVEDLQKAYERVAASEGDQAAAARAYNRLLGERYDDLESENTKLLHSLSEQGKIERQRLQTLEAARSERRLTRDEEKEIANLKRRVLDMSDDELENLQRQNAETRKQVKLAQANIRTETAQRKTLAQLVKDDLKSAKERLKTQLEFIRSLKTTEGRYAALKKAAAVGAKGATLAAKGAAVAGGLAMGAVGAAISGAQSIADVEQEAERISAPLSDREKASLINDLRIETPFDAASIVDAINRVSMTVDKKDFDTLKAATYAELNYPGMSALFAASGNTATGEDFTKFFNRMKAIQTATGMKAEDLAGVMGDVSNFADRRFQSGVTQQDIAALVSAVRGNGVYDDDETRTRAVNAFLAQKDLNSDNFYDKMKTFDWARYAHGSQAKNQADAFARNFDFGALKQASTQAVSSVAEKSSAEKAAELARKVSIKKDELLARVLEKIAPMLENGTLDKMIDNLLKVMEVALPLLEPVLTLTEKLLTALEPVFNTLVDVIKKIVDFLKDPGKYLNPLRNGDPEPQKSAGGIALSPTIVGERGAEAVIPLDYARRGRAANVIQNVQQTFNMGGNATTALSLGQAVRSRSFTDNLLARRVYG